MDMESAVANRWIRVLVGFLSEDNLPTSQRRVVKHRGDHIRAGGEVMLARSLHLRYRISKFVPWIASVRRDMKYRAVAVLSNTSQKLIEQELEFWMRVRSEYELCNSDGGD